MTACTADDLTIGATVALLDSNQGIGYKGDLPWPLISEDRNYFLGICTETSDPKKQNGIIMGRITWQELLKKTQSKPHPKLSYVITCSTVPPCADLCRAVTLSYDEAIMQLVKGINKGDLEKIFVLGGSRNYGLAIEDPRLKTLHVTRIFNDFPVDAYFPRFNHSFDKVSTSSLKEENGVKYQFEVWERKS